ncbi:dethiobiotin synthase [Haloarculaceae archaeon H-GB11]|nr:dethiobiotin synthase [Haloarculaceae archaeon H-GB11]
MTGPALAVVGTDTGVGKTVVTAGLTGWLREAGLDARAVKPVQTGHPPDDDAAVVARTCGTDDAATCGPRLEPPLAPRVAAEREGVALSYEELLSNCERALGDAEVGLLEGVGGLRVLLAGEQEVLDLVADLGVPALVVARSDLGTLNHTALSVAALRERDVPVCGIVLNEYEERRSPSGRTPPNWSG